VPHCAEGEDTEPRLDDATDVNKDQPRLPAKRQAGQGRSINEANGTAGDVSVGTAVATPGASSAIGAKSQAESSQLWGCDLFGARVTQYAEVAMLQMPLPPFISLYERIFVAISALQIWLQASHVQVQPPFLSRAVHIVLLQAHRRPKLAQPRLIECLSLHTDA
jgi:hypothetical protein